MARPKLLDTFCGGGGCSMGYHRAGFDVVGVDINPQPHYPFEFHQADALEFIAEHGHEYDVIHASPPCQAYSLGAVWRGTAQDHADLVGETRQALCTTGRPYVIENVCQAPLMNAVLLCGTMFGLRVIRHRLFECKPLLSVLTPPCQHNGTVKGGQYVTVAGHGRDGSNAYSVWCDAMGIDWMSKDELSQAIPPAYTEWIGRQLLEVMRVPAT
jgi:DNA (cytosine-5)-methyltransferase 1